MNHLQDVLVSELSLLEEALSLHALLDEAAAIDDEEGEKSSKNEGGKAEEDEQSLVQLDSRFIPSKYFACARGRG